MKIVADRHLNLHSESTPGGLIHVPAKKHVIVPDDVAKHPGFKQLVKSRVVGILEKNPDPQSYEALAAAAAKLKTPLELQKEKNEEDDEGPSEKSLIKQAFEVKDIPVVEDEDEDDDEDDDEDEGK